MDEQITILEDLLMEYEVYGLNSMDDTDYEDVSSKWQSSFGNTNRYYDVWVESVGNDEVSVNDIESDYDMYEEAFKSYLDENDIEYIDVEILTEADRGDVTFSVTIEII